MLGPFGVVQLGSNPWVNGFIALVFLVFGLSLLGAFEITIPSGMLTKLDRASQKGGILGTLLMGLTFSLTSFACVGPFMGTLLAASVRGRRLRPLLGMLGFATGLALAVLSAGAVSLVSEASAEKRRVAGARESGDGLYRAGGDAEISQRLDQVLQWNFLTRERFLAAWIVLFVMAGLYLLGFLRLEGIDKDEPWAWAGC